MSQGSKNDCSYIAFELPWWLNSKTVGKNDHDSDCSIRWSSWHHEESNIMIIQHIDTVTKIVIILLVVDIQWLTHHVPSLDTETYWILWADGFGRCGPDPMGIWGEGPWWYGISWERWERLFSPRRPSATPWWQSWASCHIWFQHVKNTCI